MYCKLLSCFNQTIISTYSFNYILQTVFLAFTKDLLDIKKYLTVIQLVFLIYNVSKSVLCYVPKYSFVRLMNKCTVQILVVQYMYDQRPVRVRVDSFYLLRGSIR